MMDKIIPKPYQKKFENEYVKHDFIHVKISEELKIDDFLLIFEKKLQLKYSKGNFKDEYEKEGYKIEIKDSGIYVEANTNHGLFYSLQTLKQLYQDDNLGFPVGEIYDKPKFKHRGMLLDCSRHFMSVDFVKRYIDLLSFLKMNIFHWHLTEDQGWRIEIKKYPNLTKIGPFRNENGNLYGGFYTQEEIKSVVSYAKSKFIQVIPEIELPGHSLAALASYPELGCFPEKKYQVEINWGVFNDVYCAGKESTFEFIENVLEEVLELFDSPLIHIGGDECPKEMWKKCKHCQQRIKDENLKNEFELQTYFIKRIEKYLLSKNRQIIGWDEILEGGIAEKAIVQSWRGFGGAIETVKSNNYAIVSPTSHCYFDYDIDTTDLKQVYTFNPIPKHLDEKYHHLILGGECNMWTERAPQELVDSKMFPRILAFTESVWSFEKDNYKDFKKRVYNLYPILDKLGVTYGPESSPVSIVVETFLEFFLIELIAGEKELNLYYSFDNNLFEKYTTPFQINQTCKIYSHAKKNGKIYGKQKEKLLEFHKGLMKKYQINHTPSSIYPGIHLLNGMRASLNFRDQQWTGFLGKDLEIEINLENEERINMIKCGLLSDTTSWIFLPSKIQVFASKDSKNYLLKGSMEIEEKKGHFIEDFEIKTDIEAQWIKICIKSFGNIPNWHPGSGNPSWTFIDQIVLK